MNSLRKLIIFTLIGILSSVSTKVLSDDSDKLVYDCSNIKRADYVNGIVKDKGYWEIIESVLYIERRNDVNISAIPDYSDEFTPWGRYAPCLKQVAVSHLKDYKIIGDRAFYNCSQMYGLYDYFDSSADKNRVNIPSGIERIGSRAFHLCYNAVIHADFRDRPIPPLVGNMAFLGVPVERCSLIIPAGSLSAYKATQWGEFGNITVLSEHAKFGMDTLWLYKGDKYYLENVIPDDVTDKRLLWYTTDPDAAIVSGEVIERPNRVGDPYPDTFGEAIVYAVAAGKSNIVAETSYPTQRIYLSNGQYYWGDTKGDILTVVVKNRLAIKINLNKSEILLNIGDNYALTNDIDIPPEYPNSVIYTKDVTWSSDKPYVAIVDGNGVVTARSSGKAVITATGDGGIKGECTVTVAAPVTGIKLARTFLYMKSEESEKLTAFRLPESSYTDIEWSSSNTQIVIVDDTGVVTALSEGSAIVTAKTVKGGFTATCEILVRKSDDAGLKSLTVQGITLELEPAFNPDSLTYTGRVLRGSNIRITAEAKHTKALVTGTGQKTLLHGADTVFHIRVTAEDKTVKEYLIRVIIDNQQGTCGDNVTWTLRDGDTLAVHGSGAMADWNDNSTPSWYNHISAIKSIVIDTGVTHIGNYAFQGCVNAASVTIAKSVESIGNYAFYGCSRLSSIDLANITSIGHMAFARCSALASVIIPESLEEFGYNVFTGCRAKSVTNKKHENPQIIDRSVFTDIYGDFSADKDTLCVYVADIETYKEAAVWKDFGTITTIENRDATLKSITVTVGKDSYPLTIVGDTAEIKIDAAASSLTIEAVPNDSLATVDGRGTKNNLPVGDTVFIIRVKAVNKITESEYAVKIKRPGRDATLKSLSVSKHTEAGIELVRITPAFDKDTLVYKVELPGSVSSITIEAEPGDSLAAVNNTGRKDNITLGNTTFHIIVQAENRSIKQEYHVKVTKRAGVMPNSGTGISNPGTATAQVYVAGGILHIESPVSERIDIYSVTGNLLYSVEKPAGKTTFAGTASGRILIVKGSSGWVKKIVD